MPGMNGGGPDRPGAGRTGMMRPASSGGVSRRVAAWLALGCVSGAAMALASWLLIAPDQSKGFLFDFPYKDKVFHILAFGGLTAPAVLVLPARYMWFWIAHMGALGAGIEVAQIYAGTGRSASVLDFLADCVGIGAAWLVCRRLRSEEAKEAAR
jgi:hypothetical protein